MPAPLLSRVILGSRTRATLVKAEILASGGTSGTKTLPTGVMDGDILLVCSLCGFSTGAITSPGNASAAYTQLADVLPGGGQHVTTHGRVLNAADITDGTFGFSSMSATSVFAIAAYRGATAFALPTASVGSASTTGLTFASFSPDPVSKALVFLAVNDATGTAPALTFSPQLFTNLAALLASRHGYVSEAAVNYQPGGTTATGFSSGNKGGAIVELT